MKKKKYLRSFLAAALVTGLVVPAALANVTSVTLEAEVEEFVVLQLETIANVIVSGDDLDPVAGSPASNEILDFGSIDPLGNNLGTLTAANGPASGTLARRLLIDNVFRDADTYSGSPPANTDGAVYYIDGGYQLRGLRNDGETTMDVQVDVSGGTALTALVDLTANNDFTDGATIAANALRTVGGAPTVLVADMPLNTPEIIDLGLFVPVSEPAGSKSTVITFTAD